MSEARVIVFQWPNANAWKALQRHIEARIKNGELKPVDDPSQVVATFSMSQTGTRWHTEEPSLDSLSAKLLYCLHASGIIDDLDVVQLNIGKVIPGPNAVKTNPGIRISILSYSTV